VLNSLYLVPYCSVCSVCSVRNTQSKGSTFALSVALSLIGSWHRAASGKSSGGVSVPSFSLVATPGRLL